MPPRFVVVGASSDQICGVREYARILSEELRRLGRGVDTSWWERGDQKGRWTSTWGNLSRWRKDDLAQVLSRPERPVVVWHYSAFSYAIRGVPLFAPLWAWRLWRASGPVVVVLHELVYPWRRRGWRGLVFAVTQRMALVAVMLAASGVVVTTEERARWLRGRRWLPRRPLVSVPVFSNVPAPDHVGRRPPGSPSVVGLFGYGSPGMQPALVTQAAALVAGRMPSLRLRLIGAPGRDSESGREWERAAAGAGLDHLEFTGTLPPNELAEAIAATDVVVFPDECGPTSRKTTLAACLAAGRAVVALDGPQRWPALDQAGAVVVTRSTPEDLARELERLLRDDRGRRELERRAAAFYRERMAPERAAQQIASFAEGLIEPVVRA